MELTHLGHACLLVQTDGARMLVDPGTFSAFDDVTGLDAVLVTHQHPDHLDRARLAALLVANPGAVLVVDPDSVAVLPALPLAPTVLRPGEVVVVAARTTVRAVGGVHAPVYGDHPGCTNCGYLVDEGALLHPGDSFVRPEQDVDVLAVAVDAPWLRVADAVDHVRAVAPRVAVPIHEGESTDPAKLVRMLAGFAPEGVVRPWVPGLPTTC